ncbi:carbohydrate-binding domain-containing protein [Coprococcus eutactus]|uniref:carbohydrate-binding domain-containing protein n=1 Tax=Coprococcus eutactus TaxID=33043 RepID=UPI00321B3F16
MRKNKYMRHRAGIRKCLAVGLTAAMCMAMLAGCSTGQSTGSTSDTEVTSDVSTETDADKESPNGSADAENTSVKTEMTVEEMQAAIDEAMSDAAIDITDMFTKRDLAGTYDESEAVKITLSGKTAACDSSNVHIEDGVVTIKAAGVYVLSGTLTDGTVVVDAGDDDKVQLVFDGVSITAADYAAIYAKNADKVFVTLTEGTENTLTVSGDYVQTDDNNVDAVIFAKCDLTLGGSGSLTVKDTTGHGIVSKDDLVVMGGTYTIDSQDHCLNGKDSVRIADGTFTLTCDEDGIHAGNDDQQDGYIYIEGGDIDISVGDDAMHAEGLLIITGGDIDISKSYEGIEGYKILVTGGDIDVVANDDGFNAARPDSNGQSDGTQSTEDDQRQTDSFQRRTKDTETNRPELPEKGDRLGDSGTPGGPGMGAGMDADYDAYILITGGTININADGDGIDSNGYLGIAGGNVYVLGPSNNGNGALDYGIYATITGGEMVAVGGSGMEQGFGDESTQCSALVNFDEWIDVGETITLTDSNGNKLLTYKADKRFDSVLISTSDMKQGETYTLTVGDQTSTFAMEDVTYSEGPGSMQGPGGDPDNGGMQGPGVDPDNGGMQRPDSTGSGGMQRPDSTGNGGMQRPDGTGDGSDAGNSQNSDKRQNGGQDNSTQSTETLKNTESISI